MKMPFKTEKEFEKSLITVLTNQKYWDKDVIQYPTEDALIQNWADILFQNNNQINRLNGCPLTKTEMQQLLDKIAELKIPFQLNEFINGKTVSIRRDNPDDKINYGNEISLEIFDRMEIQAGKTRYQIVQQPMFKKIDPVLRDRRGDLMLLINGLPVIHIELKGSGVPICQAYNQIEIYSHEGVFTKFFSLVQIFIAMTPEETIYFANPGTDGKFDKNYYFHWADISNNPVNDWQRICEELLSIPMVHQLIGFYTIADRTDGILKVMRSYQIHAAQKISDKVSMGWEKSGQKGGYIWHTTGSGKTMTSFKSAQLIADSNSADKVVFLVDRIELGTQSLIAYKNFANDNMTVQETEDSGILADKLRSSDPENRLIVTSIQKMSRIKDDGGLNVQLTINEINRKRIVFIVDECHRSVYGEMLMTIKGTFPRALFFGFTGTPISDENDTDKETTAAVFGNELARYTIADGIHDKNVLGFWPYKIETYSGKDLRRAVALEKAKAKTVEEALADPIKSDAYYKFMQDVPMVGYEDNDGHYIKGIEDYIPVSQYSQDGDKHHNAVIKDILDNWLSLSKNGKYHAILATSSITEAIQYYRLFKQNKHSLKITALFDASNVDGNEETTIEKEDGLIEIIRDYNKTYGMTFSLQTHGRFKKDIALRLAHKGTYKTIDNAPERQINLLIVVNQMLTGFDSKWINTLYLDKKLEEENIIQAFSRTNRLFGQDKPFGTIRYYRYPNTMEKNIEKAIAIYSGQTPCKICVDELPKNLENIDRLYKEISELFENAEVKNFEKLPEDTTERAKFAVLFRELNSLLESVRIQGVRWGEANVSLSEEIYDTLLQRYKELRNSSRRNNNSFDVPYDLDTNILEIETERIDDEYMNRRFERWVRNLNQPNVDENERNQLLNDLHKSYAVLSQEEQRYADVFLHDIQDGDAILESGKSFREYVIEYIVNAKNDNISKLNRFLGVDVERLNEILNSTITEQTLNEYGRFDALVETVNRESAKKYFETLEGRSISPRENNQKIRKLLRNFILCGGKDITAVI